jgi:hypothetical protein
MSDECAAYSISHMLKSVIKFNMYHYQSGHLANLAIHCHPIPTQFTQDFEVQFNPLPVRGLKITIHSCHMTTMVLRGLIKHVP